jgi:hypothetical protein
MSITMIHGNLFNDNTANQPLVHCVSQDFVMGAGIAVEFRKKFGQVDYLKSQFPPVGGMAYLVHHGVPIFYLVTKSKYWGKPTYQSLKSSLQILKSFCQEHKISQLNMPMIGCGLDQLSWPKVKVMLQQIFPSTKINVYYL